MAEHTYPEYLWLRKGDAPPPDPHESGVRVYADSSGTLHSLQSDGTDAAIGSGGGGSSVITREQFFSAPQAISPDTALAFLTWTKYSGDTLLDLSTPAGPTAIVAGVYAVTVEAYCSSGVQVAGSGMFLQLDMDRMGEDASTGAAFPLDAPPSTGTPAGSVTLVYYLPAGAEITAGLLHNVVGGLSFQLNANVQRLS